MTSILFGSLRGLTAPTPRGGGVSPSGAKGESGAARPRTPRFTFGRPKVNRKTAKTKVLESFAQSVSINEENSLPLNFVLFLIYSESINDASAAAL